jgi:hypothetical protein
MWVRVVRRIDDEEGLRKSQKIEITAACAIEGKSHGEHG